MFCLWINNVVDICIANIICNPTGFYTQLLERNADFAVDLFLVLTNVLSDFFYCFPSSSFSCSTILLFFFKDASEMICYCINYKKFGVIWFTHWMVMLPLLLWFSLLMRVWGRIRSMDSNKTIVTRVMEKNTIRETTSIFPRWSTMKEVPV